MIFPLEMRPPFCEDVRTPALDFAPCGTKKIAVARIAAEGGFANRRKFR
jgi:hypothetical protein